MDPLTASIITILGKYALDKGLELGKHVGPKALELAKEIGETVIGRFRKDPVTEVIAQEFEKKPDVYAAPMADSLQEIIQLDPNFKAVLEELVQQYDELATQYSKATGTTYHSVLKGSGAIAQGEGAVAAGKGGIAIGGNVEGGVTVGDKENRTASK